MTKKKFIKEKKEGKILNSSKELPVDLTAVKETSEGRENWDVKTLGAESTTHLEDDKGEGVGVTLRHFYFKPNPEVFNVKQPTSQELFNSHLKQIELTLWQDGWKIYDETPPRLMMSKDKSHYVIVVPAVPARGHILTQAPRTLTQIAHGRSAHSE